MKLESRLLNAVWPVFPEFTFSEMRGLISRVEDAVHSGARNVVATRIGATVEEKPKFEVGAYVPKGEDKPILIPLCGDKYIGYATRKGEVGYGLLLEACDGAPRWLYGQKPQSL